MIKRLLSHKNSRSSRTFSRLNPSLVYKKNRWKKQSVGAKKRGEFAIFGGKVDSAISTCFDSGLLIPNFFNEWIAHVERFGTTTEKIYASPSSEKEINGLIAQYNEYERVPISAQDPVLVANILKVYLRSIDGGLLCGIYKQLEILGEKKRVSTSEILYLLSLLPTPNYSMLGCLIRHLRVMADNHVGTGMDVDDLVVVFREVLSVNENIFDIILREEEEIFPGKHFIRNFSRVSEGGSSEFVLSEAALRGEINFHESTINFLKHSHISNDSGLEIMRHKYSLSYLQNELDNCLTFIPELKNVSFDDGGSYSPSLGGKTFSTIAEEEELSEDDLSKRLKVFLQSELNEISRKISERLREEADLNDTEGVEFKYLVDHVNDESNLKTKNLILNEVNQWLLGKISEIMKENIVLKSCIKQHKMEETLRLKIV